MLVQSEDQRGLTRLWVRAIIRHDLTVVENTLFFITGWFMGFGSAWSYPKSSLTPWLCYEMGFPKIGVPPVLIHFDAIIPYKPSILGVPHDYGNLQIERFAAMWSNPQHQSSASAGHFSDSVIDRPSYCNIRFALPKVQTPPRISYKTT